MYLLAIHMHRLRMYALIFEREGFQFLIDPALLWKPPRVRVRAGYLAAEVWLDEADISFMKPSRFSVRDQTRILALVRENLGELLMRWSELKDAARCGQLERSLLVD